MALIRCPGCNHLVSNLAERCALCGTTIRGASDDELQARRHASDKRARGRLRLQLLVSITLFIIGALWLIAVNLKGGGPGRMVPALLAVAGLVWYAIVRLLWWQRRR
ncbi:MAG: hypothetical protein ACREVN_05890 [Gammaproteobacteria bacterium]